MDLKIRNVPEDKVATHFGIEIDQRNTTKK